MRDQSKEIELTFYSDAPTLVDALMQPFVLPIGDRPNLTMFARVMDLDGGWIPLEPAQREVDSG